MSIHAGFLMLHKPDLKTTTVYNCLLNENCNNCEHCPISLFIVRSVSFLFSIFRCVKKFLQITVTNVNVNAFVFICFFVSLSFLAFFSFGYFCVLPLNSAFQRQMALYSVGWSPSSRLPSYIFKWHCYLHHSCISKGDRKFRK